GGTMEIPEEDIKRLKEGLGELTDPRRPWGNIKHKLIDLEADAQRFAQVIRGHWAIENQLHWALDVTFGEDASRARKDHSPVNLNILRKTALSRLRMADAGKKQFSIHRRMFKASMNKNYFFTVLFGK
ncbi:ISAs1 family transposase, partial [Treponema primitia]|uniref:ISAs1 family transposase n=1 Tax=Treponema primitia TaxID=88058 RepID=UPI00397EEADF